MGERLMTLHPEGKQGVNILKDKYDIISAAIMDIIREHGRITYKEMDKIARKKLSDSFDGSVGWYVVTVKLDLEARGAIRRIPGTSPHELELAK